MTDQRPAAAAAAASGDGDICILDAVELTRQYRRGSLSPVEVTQATLARIDALNPTLNAYCLVDHEAAVAAARAAEQRWRAGQPRVRIRSLIDAGTPSMRLSGCPARQRCSAARAAATAASWSTRQ